MIEVEEWRPTQYPTHSVSSFGRVKNNKTRIILSPPIDTYGYPKICIVVDGKIKNLRVHRLVALAFLGDPPPGKWQVAHNDGNRQNSHVSNLRWASNRENMQDKIKHGRQPRGEAHCAAKLTDRIVCEMREAYSMGFSLKLIADTFGVTSMTVHAVVNRKTWKHVA